jgi:uncharacterized protein YndB with AHSA1/START domain
MGNTRSIEQSIQIETTTDMAFEAITKASELREWFSDQAWTEVRPAGRYEVRWNEGYRADGKFTELELGHRAVCTWQGTGEPGTTEVTFTVEPQEGGVQVSVHHTGFGPGKEWDSAVAQSEKGWAIGLENLKSTLETGIDLRIARQPFLGITLDLLTPERAEKEGIAAERGIYILGALEGSGAQKAGLDHGDVMVALDGAETPGFQELGAVLRQHQAGDVVEADLVRGQERESVEITLGQRPQAEVPTSAQELADRVAAGYDEANAELKEALAGATDEQASQRAADGGWSAMQTLAHLSDGERALHVLIVNLAVNGWIDAGPVYPDQIPGRLDSIIAVAPTLNDLLGRVLTDCAETVALLSGLPEDTLAHKARFRRIAELVGFGPDHTRDHTAQIKAAIEHAQGKDAA